MTTIPERIQAEAIQIAEDVRHRRRALGTGLNNYEPTWLPIAQALLAAEKRVREEAAKIAETEGVYPELNVFGGGPEWYQHGKRIAAAIRSTN